MSKIIAQDLYDAREILEFCSGSDLSEFFASLGNPSPPGWFPVPTNEAKLFVSASMASMDSNSPDCAKDLREVASKSKVNRQLKKAVLG